MGAASVSELRLAGLEKRYGATVAVSGIAFANGTNWFRIGIADNAQPQATRRFRLELVPGANSLSGPFTSALFLRSLNFL